MKLKTLVAASVIAFLPATAFASITVDTEGVGGVQLNSLSGSSATTSDTTGGVSGLLLGPENGLHWNMRVVNSAPPGPANTDGSATYSFVVLDDAFVNLSSTQNPFGELDNLALELFVNGSSKAAVPNYNFGAMALVANVVAAPGDQIDVVADWTGMSGLFDEVDVDFVLWAQSDNIPGEIPLPATAFLLLGALGGMGLYARKRS